MPAVIAAYLVGVAAMVIIFNTQPLNELQRAGWSAVAICAAAIPLEQLSHRFRRFVAFFVAFYILLFVVAFLLLNVRLSIEWVIIVLIGAATISGKLLTFLKDWAVFIGVLVAWQLTGGLATDFNFPYHAQAMIDFDKIVGFGNVPTVWLQQRLFDPHHINWLDVLSVVVYSMHFILPVGAGFVLWLTNRQLYYRYAVAFSIAALAGFATYVLYPAVPPWMAVWHCPESATWTTKCPFGAHHYLPWIQEKVGGRTHWVPSIQDVWNFTMKGYISKNHGNVVFGPIHFGFDDVGAVPSEHVMYPTLAFLFFRRQFGRWGYLMIPYILLVVFCIVYMAQHYVFDGVVGAIYAVAIYVAVMKLWPFAMTLLKSRTSQSGPAARDERPESLVAIQSTKG
jgi:hypothetical protein